METVQRYNYISVLLDLETVPGGVAMTSISRGMLPTHISEIAYDPLCQAEGATVWRAAAASELGARPSQHCLSAFLHSCLYHNANIQRITPRYS